MSGDNAEMNSQPSDADCERVDVKETTGVKIDGMVHFTVSQDAIHIIIY